MNIPTIHHELDPGNEICKEIIQKKQTFPLEVLQIPFSPVPYLDSGVVGKLSKDDNVAKTVFKHVQK